MSGDRAGRLETANAFIRIISDHGRRFFHHEGRVAHLDLDARGRLWFVGEWNGDRQYTHHVGRWSRFHQGGTMKALVEALRDFVMGRGPLPLKYLGPWRPEYCGGDLWGYGDEEMAKVRSRCADLARATSPIQERESGQEVDDAK